MKYIFEVEYGGLGDHLFYSPLPRLMKEQGLAQKIYLSNKSKVRNKEILDLIWKSNPYLDGFSDEPTSKYIRCNSMINKVINLEMAKHGILLEKEINPELYIDVDILPQFTGRKFIDLNYISFAGAITPWDELRIISEFKDYIIVNPKKYLLKITQREAVYTKSLYEYASLIKSSGNFISLTSGGATLAAALGKKCMVFYGTGHNPINRHSCNTNIQIGGDGLIRKYIAKYLNNKNLKRIEKSQNK